MKSKTQFTADDALAINDLEPFDVPVKQWGGRSAKVRELDGEEMTMASIAATIDKKLCVMRLYACAVHLGCIDPKFSEEQALALIKKNHRVLATLGEAITEGKKDAPAKSRFLPLLIFAVGVLGSVLAAFFGLRRGGK